ncbi:hypothetical protein OHA09_36060 [Streptomyces longwoodensis]|uniref:hypothetical protein n=1 Tax=Streptomyces longwoodensis TaxID=68231 RepID=UPI002E8240DB|nr:hypothetical protein [Streptomyces longwoodensis]WUC55751.1 hypothetical protein OHA09_00915 [Streptomyces longwoodensis]WUC62130.1 hypothetical protein OHA09_36060 [Streptomyces longwoodensis]
MGQNALYPAAGRLLGRYHGAAHPVQVRAALETGRDVPAEAEGPDFRRMVHLAAAAGLGTQEVGADALAEALAAFGMFGLTAEDWAQMLSAAEHDETPGADWGPLQPNADMVARVQRASDEELVRAREVHAGLRGFYGLYVLHGLLLPDTPAQAALRQRIDAWSMFPLLDHVITLNPSPRQFAEALALCREPLLESMYEVLMEQVSEDPAIFSIPGDATRAVGFGESWMRALRELSASGRAASEGGDANERRTAG